MTARFSQAELEFLRTQRLGRLATVDVKGAPQNSPVGFFVDDDSAQIDIGGWKLGATRKFRNVKGNANVALVIDELASVNPWVVRGVEIRGTAEALEHADPPMPQMSRQVIRITPTWIYSWGLDD